MPRRDLVARRSPAARWTRRIFGVAATAVVLAVGAVTISMILPGDDDVVPRAPASTPSAREQAEQPAARRPRLTARERAQRRAAVAELARQGYEPASLDDYRPSQELRVLIGRPADGTAPGRRGFFFAGPRYIGHDAATPTMKLRPGRQLDREITLVYTLYSPGDRACCPAGGDTRVHFRWKGGELQPREAIPPAAERMPPG